MAYNKAANNEAPELIEKVVEGLKQQTEER
mgnify:CR=1 FL=1